DILSAPASAARTRRGVAGLVFAYKIAGASAARGDDLETVERFANAAVDGTRTAGVGLAPTILPAAGKPTFELAEGEMEVGVGIHGESGIRTAPIEPADAIADDLFDRMSDEVGVVPGARLAVLVNGLGATPLEELYVLYGRIAERITDAGATVVHNFIGEYATSLEMAGASISLLAVDDDLEQLLEAPAYSPFWRPGSLVPPVAPSDVASVSDDLTSASVPTASFESVIRSVVFALAESLPQHTDELRDLDAALGDGDLGITVSLGVAAMADRIRELPVNATNSALLQEAGMAFASANPSTFAALVGSGIVSASTSVDDTRPIDKETALQIGRQVAESISRRGGAQLGDKTLLDVLSPALDELNGSVSKPEFDEYLQSRVEEVAALKSARGRAAWHQERSVGLKDPGSVAVAYALSAIVGAAGD
ncbi:MAG: dihydroxyacetone kinase subunit DhaK, partial [Leifsonia flava]